MARTISKRTSSLLVNLVVDVLYQDQHLLVERLLVGQAHLLLAQLVVLGGRNGVLDIDRDDDVKQAEGHQDAGEVIDGGEAPTVPPRDEDEDRLALRGRAIACNETPEAREVRSGQRGKHLRALTGAVVAEGFPQHQGDHIEQQRDHELRPQEGLDAPDRAVDHHEELGEDGQPADTEHPGDARQAENAQRHGDARVVRDALRRDEEAQRVEHLKPSEGDHDEVEGAPREQLEAECLPPLSDSPTHDPPRNEELDREDDGEDGVDDSPPKPFWVDLDTDADGHRVQQDRHAHEDVDDRLSPLLGIQAVALDKGSAPPRHRGPAILLLDLLKAPARHLDELPEPRPTPAMAFGRDRVAAHHAPAGSADGAQLAAPDQLVVCIVLRARDARDPGTCSVR
mmetsp:Transcript_107437/g.310529  ORF Transcript_107437/g.310529 Transcript_107437/m.310529 type:complete len:397 (+) Transcript_107437:561-1751(+)